MPNPSFRPRIRWSWLILVAAVILVFACGLSGFATHARQSGDPRTVFDLFYVTGQLFAMNSGAVEGPVPWQLEIARFTAPLVAASALIGTFASLFSDRWRRWTVRFRSRHVIICGLGRKGARLVEELRQAGESVVVIEPDEHNPGLARCRELGVVVIPGRSDDDWTLERAQIRRAARLIATAGEDSVNIETAVRAHDIVQSRSTELGRLHCIAHLADPALQQLLKSHHLFGDDNDPFDLELVNVYETGARVMLERGGIVGGSVTTRICLVGLGQFGEAVLRRLLRDWAIHREETADTGAIQPELTVVIVDREAAAKEESIRQRYRDYLTGVSLHFVARDVRAPEFAGPSLAVTAAGQTFSTFFVCFDDDSLATLAALRIRERFGAECPIVVRMTEQTGFARLMDCGPGGCGALTGLRAIGFMDIACMRDLFLGGDIELLGRAFHDAYVEERRAAGDTPEQNPSLVPWHELDEPMRQSSRDRAIDIRDQLATVGLSLVPCPDRPITLHRFSPEHLDRLAKIEHDRWLDGKRADDWKYGPVRDNAKKLNPMLREWEELSDADKAFNRATVRRLPGILARADFAIR
jgi:voltage-gated potassium channel Kch